MNLFLLIINIQCSSTCETRVPAYKRCVSKLRVGLTTTNLSLGSNCYVKLVKPCYAKPAISLKKQIGLNS